MKRIVLVLAIALAVTAAVSAQSYVAQEVTGRVERDAGNGRWEAVSAGETLRADTVIRTLPGARLTVRYGEESLLVSPMKNGKLAEIAASSPAIQISGRVSETDTGAASRSSGRISTASARAGDAAGEIAIEE